MDRTSTYYKQVQLLIQILPIIAEEDCFALKGGTAINLFEKNLPRLSVDIDLVFLPIRDRKDSLTEISTTLTRIAKEIRETWREARVVEAFQNKQDALRLIVSRTGVQVKIELSPVLRGTVYEPEMRSVCDKVEEEFGFAEIQVVHPADLYAGKICAALDREHPRDLYDILLLLDDTGINEELRRAFIVYLISHPRPISELLQPGLKDISATYYGEFEHMTEEHVSKNRLEEGLKQLITTINSGLTENERQFLLSFKQNEPDWELLGLPGIKELPAVKWKQQNLGKMPAEKHKTALEKLQSVLYDERWLSK